MTQSSVLYESFDFHRECGNTAWHRLCILLDRLMADLLRNGHFHLVSIANSSSGVLSEPLTGKVVSKQKGTFRTNCIDCLDRTNVVQSLLAWRSLEASLKNIGLLSSSSSSTSHETVEDCPMVSLSATADNWGTPDDSVASRDIWPGFGPVFRAIWADNADACSLQYTGTLALKTDFTRTGTTNNLIALRRYEYKDGVALLTVSSHYFFSKGKRTFLGILMDGYHSAMRYYYNNFSDGFRQDAIDLFLGHWQLHEPNGFINPVERARTSQGVGFSGDRDVDWRKRFLPVVFGFAFSMSMLCLLFPTRMPPLLIMLLKLIIFL
ncbi:unnamed protein product [Protopolystoma xenopodis]|uniref:Phosphatidylinositol-3-phosphatase SAC1 n=1 Tax=Protopolystoma xenopodis TaxID=117903 RepID=A0A3S5B736_9PLAT|nr:unnamed protein product [Protopolystoma xenopodis]